MKFKNKWCWMNIFLNDKYKYLLKNTGLFAIANFANKIIIFLLLPFFTAYLTTTQYAVIDLAQTTQQLLFALLSLGITDAVVRFAINKSENQKNVFSLGLIIIVINILIMIILFPFLCQLGFLKSIGSLGYLFILYYSFFSFTSLFTAYLRAINNIKVMVVSSLANTILSTSLYIILIVIFKMGIHGYFYATIFGLLIQVIICISSGKLYLHLQFEGIDKKFLTKILLYALPLVPNALFWWVNNSVDRYFLSAMTSLAIVGLYSAANKIPSILNTFTSVFFQAWNLSAFIEYDSDNNKQFFLEIYYYFEFLICLATGALLLVNQLVCKLMLSKEFFNAWNLIPWLLIGFYCNALSSFLGTIFTAAKNTKLICYTTGFGALINIILNYLLVPRNGAIGSSVATYISYAAVLALRVIFLNRQYKIKVDFLKLAVTHGLLLVLCFNESFYLGPLSYYIGILIFMGLLLGHKDLLIKSRDFIKHVKNHPAG